ncbi:hypothetical protein D9M72_372360 [compost metagenome]
MCDITSFNPDFTLRARQEAYERFQEGCFAYTVEAIDADKLVSGNREGQPPQDWNSSVAGR